jgi:hypothetical protein
MYGGIRPRLGETIFGLVGVVRGTWKTLESVMTLDAGNQGGAREPFLVTSPSLENMDIPTYQYTAQ